MVWKYEDDRLMSLGFQSNWYWKLLYCTIWRKILFSFVKIFSFNNTSRSNWLQKLINKEVMAIRVCRTAEIGKKFSWNTEFWQFFDGAMEFFIPAGSRFSRKCYTEYGILIKFYGFAKFFTCYLVKRKQSLLGFFNQQILFLVSQGRGILVKNHWNVGFQLKIALNGG